MSIVVSTAKEVMEIFEYKLANQAFRYLPPLLNDRYKIAVTGRMIPGDVGRTYVKLLADAEREQTEVLIVGEVKTKLETKHFDQLRRKVKRVTESYEKLNGREIVPMIVVLHAPEPELRRAARRGVIVVQSWEWSDYMPKDERALWT